jgi:DNA-binding transcriptional LysR family regulator
MYRKGNSRLRQEERSMNDTQIQCFLALAEYENYTEAARRLFISQPVVSKYIAMLEDEWGVPLFYRTKRDVGITAEGRVMLDAIQKIKAIYEQGIEQAREISGDCTDHLNIAFLQTIDVANELRAVIQEIMDEQPSLRLTLDRLSHKGLNEGLENGDINVAITMEHEVRHNPELSHITLMILRQSIVANEKHPLSQSPELNMELLKHQRFFAVEDGSFGYKQYVELLQREFGIEANQIKIVPDIDSLLLNVESGLGVALLSELPQLAHNYNIRMFPIDHLPIAVVAAWRKDDDKGITNEFIKLLVKTFQKKPPRPDQ